MTVPVLLRHSNTANLEMAALNPHPADRAPVDPAVYMQRFKAQAALCIGNAYRMERTAKAVRPDRDFSNDTVDGGRGGSNVLTLSLAEDVFSLLDTQRSALHSYLTSSNLLVPSSSASSSTSTTTLSEGQALFLEGLLSMLRDFQSTHASGRAAFYSTAERCCAASNDFFRMSERMENFLEEIRERYPFLSVPADDWWDAASAVSRLGSDVVSMLYRDAVHAAERVQLFALSAAKRGSVSDDLFSVSWEEDWTHNEVAARLVDVFDGYLKHAERNLCNDFLYNKVVVVSAKALVCFYVRCLVEKADSVSRRRWNDRDRYFERRQGQGRRRSSSDRCQPFRSPKRALIRMLDDIGMLRDFVNVKAAGSIALKRIVANQMRILELIHECMESPDLASLESFIVVIHKRTGADCLVTRYFVGDLWLLLSRGRRSRQDQDQIIKETLAVVQPDLRLVSTRMKERLAEQQQSPRHASSQQQHLPQQDQASSVELSFLRLDEMLKTMYEDRIAQGILPLCWTCLPKENAGIIQSPVVVKTIRDLTRNLAEMKW